MDLGVGGVQSYSDRYYLQPHTLAIMDFEMTVSRVRSWDDRNLLRGKPSLRRQEPLRIRLRLDLPILAPPLTAPPEESRPCLFAF